MPKAKAFRVAVEGATTDGRNIERNWLQQMADSYDKTVYTATINLEHIKAFSPDSAFKRYGVVESLSAEEITDGPLSGKLALYAALDVTDELVNLVKTKQKLFTSIEIDPNFAKTGQAYLVGLAATDDPASLGTEMLTFSRNATQSPLASRKTNPGTLFTAAEPAHLELDVSEPEKSSLFSRVTALFAKKQQSEDARFTDVHQAVELVVTEQQRFNQEATRKLNDQQDQLTKLKQHVEQQQTRFSELTTTLSLQDHSMQYRPITTGGNGSDANLTDC